MFTNGVTRKALVTLIRAGLATAQREIKAGGQTVGRVRITEAGRPTLEGRSAANLSPICSMSGPLGPGTPPQRPVLDCSVRLMGCLTRPRTLLWRSCKGGGLPACPIVQSLGTLRCGWRWFSVGCDPASGGPGS